MFDSGKLLNPNSCKNDIIVWFKGPLHKQKTLKVVEIEI